MLAGSHRYSGFGGSTTKLSFVSVANMQSGYLRKTTHAAPHSRIFAACHTVAGLKPRMIGMHEKIEVSLERPATMTSAPFCSASMNGSTPHMPTRSEERRVGKAGSVRWRRDRERGRRRG